MKKTMKLMTITIAMLGLTVTANKAFAQRVSIGLNLGGASIHYQNYGGGGGYYGGHERYERPVVYEQPVVYAQPIAYGRPVYDRGYERRDNCGRENERFSNGYRNRYRNNDNDNRWGHNEYGNRNNNGYNRDNNGYNGGYGRRH